MSGMLLEVTENYFTVGNVFSDCVAPGCLGLEFYSEVFFQTCASVFRLCSAVQAARMLPAKGRDGRDKCLIPG